MPTPSETGAPLMIVQGLRSPRQRAAKISDGSAGFMASEMAPTRSLTNRTLRQVAPPSCERKTPRSGLGPKGEPSAATYTRLGSFGWTLTAPIWPASRSPAKDHVLPASVDL